MMEILYAALRSLGIFVLLLMLIRFMGRKHIGQMTFSDFVVGITIGTAGANAAIGPADSIIPSATTVLVLSILAIASGYIHIKSFSVRKLIDSEPVTLIENGNIVEPNMRKIRLTLDELMMKLREKDAFNIADVEFAIMETDGELSVLQKSQKQPLTPGDMNMSTTGKGLTKDIIIDGNLMKENLKDAYLDENWLKDQLKSQGINDISEVFYAGVDDKKTLYVSRRNGGREREGKYGIE